MNWNWAKKSGIILKQWKRKTWWTTKLFSTIPWLPKIIFCLSWFMWLFPCQFFFITKYCIWSVAEESFNETNLYSSKLFTYFWSRIYASNWLTFNLFLIYLIKSTLVLSLWSKMAGSICETSLGSQLWQLSVRSRSEAKTLHQVCEEEEVLSSSHRLAHTPSLANAKGNIPIVCAVFTLGCYEPLWPETL